MPNFIEIGGVTRKPLVDLTRTDPCIDYIEVREILRIYANIFHDALIQEAFGGSLGPNGMVWTTYSDIGVWRYGIIFSVALQSGYDLHPHDAGFGHQVCIITYYSFILY